eukprot:10256133-Alexandrium_andersonii.AAC.1
MPRSPPPRSPPSEVAPTLLREGARGGEARVHRARPDPPPGGGNTPWAGSHKTGPLAEGPPPHRSGV